MANVTSKKKKNSEKQPGQQNSALKNKVQADILVDHMGQLNDHVNILTTKVAFLESKAIEDLKTTIAEHEERAEKARIEREKEKRSHALSDLFLYGMLGLCWVVGVLVMNNKAKKLTGYSGTRIR